MGGMRVELLWRTEAGQDEAAAKPLAMTLWRAGPGWTMMSSGVLGGGLGAREWVLNARLADSDNSIAIIVTHMAGNLRSRFSDFLSSDGEKPWRDRDREFVPGPSGNPG